MALVYEAFLGSVRAIPLRGPKTPSASVLGYPKRIYLPGNTYHLASDNPPPDGLLAPASLLRLERTITGTGILTRFPSATPLGLALGAD